MDLSDAFNELGLAESVSMDEAKAKYRSLAMRWHPDRNPGIAAETRMKALNVAYSVVTDHLKSRSTAAAFATERQRSWQPPRNRTAKKNKPLDKSLDRIVSITLTEALHGCFRRLAGQLENTCMHCGGKGHAPNINSDFQCSTCIGAGYYAERGPNGLKGRVIRCPACSGLGRIQTPCKSCEGTGRTEGKVWRVTVKVPAGVRSGSLLRVPVEAEGGFTTVVRVTVNVQKHHLFQRNGLDLSVEVPVSIWRWYMGGEILAPTPTGVVRVAMQPMSEKITMAAGGMPDPENPNIRGALYFVPTPVAPTELSSDQLELLEKLDAVTPLPKVEKWALDLTDWRDACEHRSAKKA